MLLVDSTQVKRFSSQMESLFLIAIFIICRVWSNVHQNFIILIKDYKTCNIVVIQMIKYSDTHTHIYT